MLDEDANSADGKSRYTLTENQTVLLVQDRRFAGMPNDAVRTLMYMDMAMDSDGMLGDTVLVNGSVLPKQDVANTLHRYRLYNVSNARTYKFALSDGSKFTIVGTAGIMGYFRVGDSGILGTQ
ncbi:MAG: hypothetical protein Q9M36_04150 [Sulfurovum sp.]|nr:hypothetical protein [Sulfurovum sp.]